MAKLDNGLLEFLPQINKGAYILELIDQEVSVTIASILEVIQPEQRGDHMLTLWSRFVNRRSPRVNEEGVIYAKTYLLLRIAPCFDGSGIMLDKNVEALRILVESIDRLLENVRDLSRDGNENGYRYYLFRILALLCSHTDDGVGLGAFQVYLRRAYAYSRLDFRPLQLITDEHFSQRRIEEFALETLRWEEGPESRPGISRQEQGRHIARVLGHAFMRDLYGAEEIAASILLGYHLRRGAKTTHCVAMLFSWMDILANCERFARDLVRLLFKEKVLQVPIRVAEGAPMLTWTSPEGPGYQWVECSIQLVWPSPDSEDIVSDEGLERYLRIVAQVVERILAEWKQFDIPRHLRMIVLRIQHQGRHELYEIDITKFHKEIQAPSTVVASAK